MISFYPEPKGYDCISSTWIFKEKMNLEGKKKFCQWVLEFEQRSKLSIGTEWKASGPFHKSKREFFVWFERRSKAKKSKEIPLWKGKETSVASYYFARITSAITSVFRSPFVFEPGVHVEPFQYVRVCKPTSLFLCSYLQKKWDSFHYFPGPQRPGLRSCRILFSEFGTVSFSPESCRCVDVDRRLPITTASFPFYIPIWWTRSCGEIKIDPWFLKFFIWKETFWWLYNLCIQGS